MMVGQGQESLKGPQSWPVLVLEESQPLGAHPPTPPRQRRRCEGDRRGKRALPY